MCTTPGRASSVRLASTRMEPAGVLSSIQSSWAMPSARASAGLRSAAGRGRRPRVHEQPVGARVDEHRQARPGVQDERVVARRLGVGRGALRRRAPGRQRVGADLRAEPLQHRRDELHLARRRREAALQVLPLRRDERVPHRHAAGVLARARPWSCRSARRSSPGPPAKATAGSASPSGAGLSSGSSSPSRRARSNTMSVSERASPERGDRRLGHRHVLLRVAAHLAALHRAAGREHDVGVARRVGGEQVDVADEVELLDGLEEAVRRREHAVVEAEGDQRPERDTGRRCGCAAAGPWPAPGRRARPRRGSGRRRRAAAGRPSARGSSNSCCRVTKPAPPISSQLNGAGLLPPATSKLPVRPMSA